MCILLVVTKLVCRWKTTAQGFVYTDNARDLAFGHRSGRAIRLQHLALVGQLPKRAVILRVAADGIIESQKHYLTGHITLESSEQMCIEAMDKALLDLVEGPLKR